MFDATHRKPRLSGTAMASALLAAALLPQTALAATITIQQTAEDGIENPPSTITVKDKDSGEVVYELEYEGGSAAIEPLNVELEKRYSISAEADGYSFTPQVGKITSDINYNVSLKAVRAADVSVSFVVDEVDDYTGIKVSLFAGADTQNQQPKFTATSDSSGEVIFPNVAHGEYTLVLDLPAALASSGLPATKAISVPADSEDAVIVEISPGDASTAATASPSSQSGASPQQASSSGTSTSSSGATTTGTTSSSQPSSSSSSSASSSSSSASDVPGSTSSKESMSATGDPSIGIAAMFGLAGAAGASIATVRRKGK